MTLEPCCHHGKTPPCTDAIVAAGIRRVVVAMRDPNPQVAGGGIKQLRDAGVEVVEGVLEHAAARQNAPYCKLVGQNKPWVLAKWAMTLDGKIATAKYSSQWISNEVSRAAVHALRGRVDAIMVGRNTAAHDDPLLMARPPGPAHGDADRDRFAGPNVAGKSTCPHGERSSPASRRRARGRGWPLFGFGGCRLRGLAGAGTGSRTAAGGAAC